MSRHELRLAGAALSLCLFTVPAVAGPVKVFVSADFEGLGQRDIYMINPDGTNPQNLTVDFNRDAARPFISPDGRRILFKGRNDSGRWEAYVMGSDGRNPRKLTNLDHQYFDVFGWLDNGTALYRWAPGPGVGDIRALDIQTLDDTLLFPASGVGEGSIDDAVVVSGGHIVFIAQPGSSGYSADLFQIEFDGSAWIPSCFYEDVVDSYGEGSLQLDEFGNVFWEHVSQSGGSPNPEHIVVKSVDSGADCNNWDAMIRAAGPAEITLCAVSPDGSTALVEIPDSSGDLYSIDTTTGVETLILSGGVDIAPGSWGETNEPCPMDLVPDGVIDLADLGLLLSEFGSSCP
jgi:hypothetical protein